MAKAESKKAINWLGLLAAVIVVELIGNIGSLATFSQITSWYAGLNKPAFNPPNWLFGPVWTILFGLMGITIYLIWRANWQREPAKLAAKLFTAQLLLNVLWSFLFFGAHQPGLALAEIILLWFAILAVMVIGRKVSPAIPWLLAPYLAWVSFATILTLAIWQLN